MKLFYEVKNYKKTTTTTTTITTKPYLKTLYIRHPQNALQLNNFKKQVKNYKKT